MIALRGQDEVTGASHDLIQRLGKKKVICRCWPYCLSGSFHPFLKS